MKKANRSVFILLLVLSGMIISICMGLRQSLGLFMQPMVLDTGITAAAFERHQLIAPAVNDVGRPLGETFQGLITTRSGHGDDRGEHIGLCSSEVPGAAAADAEPGDQHA